MIMCSELKYASWPLGRSNSLRHTLVCSHCEAASEGALPALHESGFVLQNGKSFFEAVDLSLSPCLPLFIRLWLCNAPILDLTIIIKNCRELSIRCVPVSTQVRDALVQTFEFFGLILDILRLHCGAQLVLLSGLLVDLNGISLLLLLSCKILCEVALADFENVDNGSTSTGCFVMLLWCSRLLHEGIKVGSALHKSGTLIVILQHTKCLLDARDAQFKLCFGLVKSSFFLGTDTIHFRLLFSESGQLGFQCLNIFFQTCRLSCSQINL